MRLELFIAWRYLTSRRKQTLVPVISLIAILGIAAGVMAMIIALALSTGFREEIQTRILFATSHINLMRLDSGPIGGLDPLLQKIGTFPGVKSAAPVIYDQVFLSSGNRSHGAVLKGIEPEREKRFGELRQQLLQGTLEELERSGPSGKEAVLAGIILGKELADSLSLHLGDTVRAYSARGRLSPMGMVPGIRNYRVVGIFASGLWDYDLNWAYVSLSSAQSFFNMPAGSAGVVEVRVTDIYDVEAISQKLLARAGPGFTATHWIDLNRPLFSAMKLEKLAMFVTVCLIVMVAALNIVTTLVMMVMEKNRDIGILNAMGATERNILRVFMLQGLVLGTIGTLAGSVLGVAVSWLLDRYRLIRLEPEVYAIPYVPFQVQGADVLLVAFSAILISFLATLYPARTAARLNPVEALRYE